MCPYWQPVQNIIVYLYYIQSSSWHFFVIWYWLETAAVSSTLPVSDKKCVREIVTGYQLMTWNELVVSISTKLDYRDVSLLVAKLDRQPRGKLVTNVDIYFCLECSYFGSFRPLNWRTAAVIYVHLAGKNGQVSCTHCNGQWLNWYSSWNDTDVLHKQYTPGIWHTHSLKQHILMVTCHGLGICL